MRIINPLDRDNYDLKPPVRALADSGDRVKAAKGRRLLELVRCLEAQGPAPEAGGGFHGEELWLHVGRGAAAVTVTVRVDWKDYGPVEGGLPVMHYRVRVRRPRAALTEEARPYTPEEAGRVILRAFGGFEPPQ